jgi:hypothetical protein
VATTAFFPLAWAILAPVDKIVGEWARVTRLDATLRTLTAGDAPDLCVEELDRGRFPAAARGDEGSGESVARTKCHAERSERRIHNHIASGGSY